MSFHYVDTYGAGFREMGAPLHPQGDIAAWSSINERTGTVVLAMWESGFKRDGDSYISDGYESGSQAWHRNLSTLRKKRNSIRSSQLQTLRSKPRLFRAFIVISPFLDEHIKVAQSMVVDGLELELLDFDPKTCEHRAKVIHPNADEFGAALLDIRTRYAPALRDDP